MCLPWKSIDPIPMDNVKVVAQKLQRWFSELALLVLVVGTLWAQAARGAVAASQNQTSQNQASQNQASNDQASHENSANDAARATQETTVSPKAAKELFRSVDEIVQFASQDTGLPLKHEVKRRFAKRDDVQSYIGKNMKDDNAANRLKR